MSVRTESDVDGISAFVIARWKALRIKTDEAFAYIYSNS